MGVSLLIAVSRAQQVCSIFFLQGTMIRFVIPNLDTPWQKAEDLGWKDRIAMKGDSGNAYQYAPNGLVIVKVSLRVRQTMRGESALKKKSGLFYPSPCHHACEKPFWGSFVPSYKMSHKHTG